MKWRWHSLLTQDPGRKLLALLFALVLFDLLDRKVQTDDKKTLTIVYVDADQLERLPEDRTPGSVLLVVERGKGGSALVAAFPRPQDVTLHLHGPKEAIEKVQERRQRLVFRLGKEGRVEPAATELEGLAAIVDELGTGGKVEFDPPLHFVVEAEDRRALVLRDEDLELRGAAAPGHDLRAHSAVFRPGTVIIVGPRSAVADAERRRSELLEEVVVHGQTELVQEVRLATPWRDRVRLLAEDGSEIATVKVALQFERKLVVAPGGSFKKPVQVLYDDALLAAKGATRFFRDGWQLQFDKAHGGGLELELAIQAPATQAGDRVKVDLAKEQVELVVRAYEAAGSDRATVAVHVIKCPDFPEDLDITFANGERRADVEVIWVRTEGNGAARTPDEKKGGNGNE